MAKTKYMTMDEIANVLLQNEEAVDKIYVDVPENSNKLLNILQNVDSKELNYEQLVFQFKKALTDKTPEAREFINNLNLFVKPICECGDEGNRKNFKPLLNKIHDEKLKYYILQKWEELYGRFGDLDYAEDELKVYELVVKSPYATANDILEFCQINKQNGLIDLKSDMFQRGLKKFDEEFVEEANKENPQMGKWYILRNILHLIDDFGWDDVFDCDIDEYVKFISKYGDEAIDMRIRILMLEKENKKLKAELKKAKTDKFKTGIDNVVKKSGATKPIISKSKMR